MVELQKPFRRPERPWFSSGPTVKRPGWTPEAALGAALVGRGIRAPAVLARLKQAIELTREVLQVPADYAMTFLPGSDTGAMESAMWTLLGPRRVQALAYENFGQVWAADLLEHLDVEAEAIKAPYGEMADLSKVDPEADLVFVWNGTTSGVRVPDADFIAADRKGLTICDATSAAFAMPLDWSKLDVTTFSFQKALGGEAGIGAMVLSPRALQRLNSFTPTHPVPKIIRIQKGGVGDAELIGGYPVNTYSMLTIEDWMDGLRWAARVGGLEQLIRRTNENFAILSAWVERTPWIDFLAKDPAIRSQTSVVLEFVDPAVRGLAPEGRAAFGAKLCALLEREGVGFDLNSHRSAPPGLRIWCGCTVERDDVEALLPWIEWAYHTTFQELATA
ncbi:MAG: phosphoserine transaminase [Proteobacteria bacterium]|nr:phosphoserine transaminase [Pseudomonadota bacterium]